MQIRKMQKKIEKKRFLFEINASDFFVIQLSLLIREYLSSEVNVLRKRLKNFHVSKSDFRSSIHFTVITQDNKGALINIESVLRHVYHVACRGVLPNGTF